MSQRFSTTIISLIGAPGSGKGTYGSLLASRLKCTFLSVGDVLREYSEQNPSIKQTLQSGSLMDDRFVADVILQRLQGLAAYKSHVVILDGFPRNNEQTKILSMWPDELQKMIALHFDVPDEICVTKLLGRRKCSICNKSFNVNGIDRYGFHMPPLLPIDGSCPVKCNQVTDWKKRDDDSEETIRKRMNIYHDQTESVLKYWLEKDKLTTFVPYNGVSDINAIYNKVQFVLRDQF